MRYKVELIRSEEGFPVGCPELPGCWTQGATEEEALQNIQAAIKDYLGAAAEMQQRREVHYVEVQAS